MASVSVYTTARVPAGLYVHLSHPEACFVTDNKAVSAITTYLGTSGQWWAYILALAIFWQAYWIRDKNKNSAGKGVRLKFSFLTGMIVGIRRKGKGASPSCVISITNPNTTSPKTMTRLPFNNKNYKIPHGKPVIKSTRTMKQRFRLPTTVFRWKMDTKKYPFNL